MGHDAELHVSLLRRCFSALGELHDRDSELLLYVDPTLLSDLGAAVSDAFDARFPVAAAPLADPPLPARSVTLVRLPPPGRRGPDDIYAEDRAIALIVKRAGGEWVEFDGNGRVKPYLLSNWVSKFHGSSRAFPVGEYRATTRNGRLFARYVG